MDLDLIKTVAEVVGAVLTMLAVLLMGRTGRTQRWGVIVCLASVVPWTVFAVVTSSWMMVGQSAFLATINIINLINLYRRPTDAP